jgi:hypothetical protein
VDLDKLGKSETVDHIQVNARRLIELARDQQVDREFLAQKCQCPQKDIEAFVRPYQAKKKEHPRSRGKAESCTGFLPRRGRRE